MQRLTQLQQKVKKKKVKSGEKLNSNLATELSLVKQQLGLSISELNEEIIAEEHSSGMLSPGKRKREEFELIPAGTFFDYPIYSFFFSSIFFFFIFCFVFIFF